MTHYSHFLRVLGKMFTIQPNHKYLLHNTDFQTVLVYSLQHLGLGFFYSSGKTDTALRNQRALSSSYRRAEFVPGFTKALSVA